MSNKIRKIIVGTDMTNQMNYILGSKHSVWIDGKRAMREIHNILECEESYRIYLLGEDNEVQLWKKLPKNNQTSIEYIID